MSAAARMRAIVLRTAAAASLVLQVSGCDAGQPWAEVGGERYRVEVADEPDERTRGLMFRDELAPDRGMVFVWRRAEPRSFWMRNTRIPLDIVYIGPDRRIVGWSLDTPPCRTRRCPSYPSGAPAQFVLEVNAGEMERLGVRIGDEVRFGNIDAVTEPDS